MKLKIHPVKLWACASMALVLAVIAFLFGYVFFQGRSAVTWEFLSTAPSGSVLGSEGGVWPAIVGSLCFTLTAVVLGGVPAVATALYLVFYCRSKRLLGVIHTVIQNIAGIPSIVLGLFAYSLLVRDLSWGRCVLSGGVALAMMALPFIEVRAEKAFRELPAAPVQSAYALGCSKFYTIRKIVLPACRGELVSGVILGACYAMGATAPLMFTGGVAYAALPVSPTRPAMALPLHLYLLLAQGTSMPQAYGTAFVLMAVVLASNALATLYARRRNRAWKQL